DALMLVAPRAVRRHARNRPGPRAARLARLCRAEAGRGRDADAWAQRGARGRGGRTASERGGAGAAPVLPARPRPGRTTAHGRRRERGAAAFRGAGGYAARAP